MNPLMAGNITLKEYKVSIVNRSWVPLIAVMLGLGAQPVLAEGEAMSGMNHGSMTATDNDSGMDMGGATGAMQGGSAPADARDPHAYSDGYDFGAIPRPRFADEQNFASLWMDRFEAVRSENNTSLLYDLQAWFGRDYDRLVLKAEGTLDDGKLDESSTELLWGHAVATYWDGQLGLRYDSGDGSSRSWLAFGLQGLAPYWFEVDITGYIGEQGRTALSLEAEYEILFTQRLILQPRLEADVYGKDDAERGIGAGLSEVAAGLRLRYEVRREIAPYVGVEWAGKYGGSADYARAAGVDSSEMRAVAGVRFWF